MRVLACLLAAACAGRAAAHSPRSGPPERRCTLRVSARGISVDGDPMSRVAAVAYCKRTGGALVRIEDGAPPREWDQTRAALEHEGVAIVIPGRAADDVPWRRQVVVPTPMSEEPRPRLVPASPK